MSDITQELQLKPAGINLTDRLVARMRVSQEALAYAALLAAAFGMRFWDLGSRAVHHDESLHGYSAYQLLQGNGFEHTPLLHGPFQVLGTAAVFFLGGGATDYSLRILPAAFGTLLIALPLLFRSHLGRSGALLAAGMIAFSPTLLYYSRFAREDVYVAAFTLGLVICLWRYLAEQRMGFLYGAAVLLALSFATKENTFITAGILLVFLDLWVAALMVERAAGHRGWGVLKRLSGYVLFAPTAWIIVALWPLLARLRRRLGLGERHAAMDMLLVLGTFTGPQLAAAIQLPIEATGAEIDTQAEERLVGMPIVAGLLAASAIVGLLWNGRAWARAAASFYVPYALIFTTFGTNPEGFAGGIWESLDYWLGQHEAARANQPEYYYLMFFPMYEFVTLALAVPALLFLSLRGGPRSWLLTSLVVLLLLAFFGADSFGGGLGIKIAGYAAAPAAAVGLLFAVRGSWFERLLVFWTAASLVAYSFAGERMPWLAVHVTLPALILGAYSAGRLLESGGTTLGRNGARAAGAVALTAVALLLVLSVRTAIRASFDHGDVPSEFLVYTQTSPDLKDAAARIERLAGLSGAGEDLRVQVDRALTWPWAWYLRDYDLRYFSPDEGFVPDTGAVLLVSAQNEIYLDRHRGRYLPAQPFVLRWFFPEEGYRSAGRAENLADGLEHFAEDLRFRSTWSDWWDYFLSRDIQPRVAAEGRLYIPAEYAGIDLGELPVTRPPTGQPGQPPDVEGRLFIGRLGSEPGQMQGPIGVDVDASGNVFVVDSGNSRVQKFDVNGTFVAAAGGPGGEPGQFNQPSGIAVDSAGNVYVADTWNHRIQKLAPDLSFLAAWGKPARDLVNPRPDELWGPRGIAIDREGNVLVADTGTHRIRKYSPAGEHIASFGSRGNDPGQFNEPVGIAAGADGSIFVADVGNARIQRFGSGFVFLAEYPIEDWSDRNPRNRPQLVTLPDGRLLATDGTHGRLLLLAREGLVISRLEAALEVPLFFPAGVSYDDTQGFVYLTDGLAGHLRRFPLSDFALR